MSSGIAEPDAVEEEVEGCTARARRSAWPVRAELELLVAAAGGFSSRCLEPDCMLIFKDVELGVVNELVPAS